MIPLIPDEVFAEMSKRDRQVARDTQVLLMIAMAPTIEERNALADRADTAIKRLDRFADHYKQNPRTPSPIAVQRMPLVRRAMPFAQRRLPQRQDDRRSVFRLPGLQRTILELNGAVMNQNSILYRDRDPRFMDMGAEIHSLMHKLRWIPSDSP
jgi:hypothetical protein